MDAYGAIGHHDIDLFQWIPVGVDEPTVATPVYTVVGLDTPPLDTTAWLRYTTQSGAKISLIITGPKAEVHTYTERIIAALQTDPEQTP